MNTLSPEYQKNLESDLYLVKVGFDSHVERYEPKTLECGAPSYDKIICKKKDHAECGVDKWFAEGYTLNSNHNVVKSWTKGNEMGFHVKPGAIGNLGVYNHFSSQISRGNIHYFITRFTGLDIKKISPAGL